MKTKQLKGAFRKKLTEKNNTVLMQWLSPLWSVWFSFRGTLLKIAGGVNSFPVDVLRSFVFFVKLTKKITTSQLKAFKQRFGTLMDKDCNYRCPRKIRPRKKNNPEKCPIKDVEFPSQYGNFIR